MVIDVFDSYRNEVGTSKKTTVWNRERECICFIMEAYKLIN